MATIAEIKTGDLFTGSYEGATRKFRVFIKNVTLTTNGSGTATVTVGSIGLRKSSGGDVEVLVNHGNPRVWANFNGSSHTKSATSSIELDGTAPVDKNIATNWTWTVQQTSSEQTLTMDFHYKKNDGYAWSGESNGTLSITIPAYSGGSANEVYLTNLLSKRNGSYALTTFSITGSYTVISATVSITVNGYTYYDTPTQSGTSFTSNKYVALGTTDTASVSVSVFVTPTGGSAIYLSDSTSISSGSPSVAIDFYNPYDDTYNIGIGCVASENSGVNNRIDISGNLYLNGTEITGGGGGGEPAAYIKSATVAGNTLTLTNKDDSPTSYTPTIPSTYLKSAEVSSGKLVLKNQADSTVVTYNPTFSPTTSDISCVNLTSTGKVYGSNSRNLINNATSGECHVGNSSDATEIYGNYIYLKGTVGKVSTTATDSTTYRVMRLTSEGKICNYDTSSSRRYKTDITENINDDLNPKHLYDMPMFQYKYKDDHIVEDDSRKGKDIYGIIVEELEKVYPIAVDYNDNGEPESWNQFILMPALLGLIKEQHEEIEILKAKVDAIERSNQ